MDWRLLRASELTLVPTEPARHGWFGVWSNDDAPSLPIDTEEVLERCELDIVLAPGAQAAPHLATVDARALDMGTAIQLLAATPATADLRPSVLAWSAVVRSALQLVARGRVLPWVSPEGWDTWRIDPLDPADVERVAALAAALPATAYAVPTRSTAVDAAAGDAPRVIEPEFAIRSCYDAVGDRFLRTEAAAELAEVDPFAAAGRTRVRHLRPWVEAVAAPHCSTGSLAIRIVPPEHDREEWELTFYLRGRNDPSSLVAAGELWGLDGSSTRSHHPAAEIDLLMGLRRAADICPVLAAALDQPWPSEMLVGDEGIDALLEKVDDLAAEGIELRWPKDFVTPRIERQLVVTAPDTSDSGDRPFADLAALLEVDWEFLLDGLPLTVAELHELANARRAIVPFGGRWVRVTSADKQRLQEPPPQLGAAELLAAVLSGDELDLGLAGGGVPVRLDEHALMVVERVRQLESGREEPEPLGLHAELRDYQRRGLAWLSDLTADGLGGCLADDMGLGKTVQVLALHARRGGPTLVVCPTSVLANWEREAARFVPDARVLRFHGPGRSLDAPRSGDLVLTSYGVVRSDAERLGAFDWDVVVADEAQAMKNHRSRTARAMRELTGRSHIALTGTPVENRLTELWAIMDWAVPGLLGGVETFKQAFAIPIERDADDRSAERLGRVLAPFLLRRRKSDPGIAPELPPKTERDVAVAMTAEQVALYRATTSHVLNEITSQEDGITRRGLVLKLLTALKQITNHPAHYLDQEGPLQGRSGKLVASDELLDTARSAGESTLVFTQYVAMGRLLVEHCRSRGLDADLLHGSLSVGARDSLVTRFQNRELPVLILSLKAGGTGLNLTAATQVIHYDRWWNPAVEDQATDRAYRIGQDQPVTVHRLITEGTVEDKVAALLAEKRELADRVIGAGESWIGQLDDDELAELVLLDGDPGEEGAP